MSSNIYGYQGVNTPLENLTNGRYTVADYTTLRKEFNARIKALENTSQYEPNAITVQSSIHVIPGANGDGSLSATGSATIGKGLTVTQNLNCLGSMNCNGSFNIAQNLQAGNLYVVGDLQVDGNTNINLDNISADSAAVSGNISAGSMTISGNVTAAAFVGNGSALTAVDDSTKLPKAGGTLTGPLIATSIVSNGNISVNGGYQFSGNGAGLTNIDDITKLPKAGGTMTGSLTLTAPAKFIGDGSLLSYVDDTTKLPKAGGTLTGPLISTSILSNGDITANGGFKFNGNGAGLTDLDDTTKVPKAGGTMTGSLTLTAPAKYYGDGSQLSGVIGTDSTKVLKAGDTMTGSLTLTAPAKYYGDGSQLSGVIATDSTKVLKAGDTMTGSLTLTAPAKYYGDGSQLSGVIATDSTKLPLAGGTLTGTLYTRDINVNSNYTIYGNGSNLAVSKITQFDNLVGSVNTCPTFWAKNVMIVLNYANTCTVALTNLTVDSTHFTDQVRYVTIVKAGLALNDFTVTVTKPVAAGITYYWLTPTLNLSTGNFVLPAGVFSVTLLIYQAVGSTDGYIYLVNKA